MKHAYLLLLHNYDENLEFLLKSLDHLENDIFIHVDRKTINFPFDKVRQQIKLSTLYFTPNRVDVSWGGSSQIDAELELLSCSTTRGCYQYYHLLSGSDLPLKSQDEIHDFFNKNDGKEFVDFFNKKFIDEKRVIYYHFFRNFYGRSETINKFLVKMFSKLLLYFQILFRIKRTNKDINFQKGSNWFSITDNLARYIVTKTDWIREIFSYTDCADEVFLQTLVINSRFIDNVYNLKFDNSIFGNMRLTLWDGKNCHVFTDKDIDVLKNTDALFARKFDLTKQPKLRGWIEALNLK